MTEQERAAWTALRDGEAAIGHGRMIRDAIGRLLAEDTPAEKPLPPEGMVVEVQSMSRGESWRLAWNEGGGWFKEATSAPVKKHDEWRYLPPHWTGEKNVRLILEDGSMVYLTDDSQLEGWRRQGTFELFNDYERIIHVDIRESDQ